MMQKFTQEMKSLMNDTIRDIHTVLPGRIISFDPDKCEAVVLPYAKFRKPNGKIMDFPQISEVPVYIMQGCGQTATVVYPIRPNDDCILLFSEQALDVWRTNASSDTELKFDLQNAMAIVGLFVKPNILMKEACDDDSLIVEKDGERLRLKKGETYISDTAGQSITMTPSSTTMVVNNLVIKSKGNIDITAAGNITTIAGGNIKENAARIDHN